MRTLITRWHRQCRRRACSRARTGRFRPDGASGNPTRHTTRATALITGMAGARARTTTARTTKAMAPRPAVTVGTRVGTATANTTKATARRPAATDGTAMASTTRAMAPPRRQWLEHAVPRKQRLGPRRLRLERQRPVPRKQRRRPRRQRLEQAVPRKQRLLRRRQRLEPGLERQRPVPREQRRPAQRQRMEPGLGTTARTTRAMATARKATRAGTTVICPGTPISDACT